MSAHDAAHQASSYCNGVISDTMPTTLTWGENMQSIRRVDPVSAMKVSAVLYAFIGLFIGLIISLISVAGFMATASQDMPGAFRFVFGVAAIIVAPIFY